MPKGLVTHTGGGLATQNQTDNFRDAVEAFFKRHPEMTNQLFDAGIEAKCYIKHIRQRDCRRTRVAFLFASKRFMDSIDEPHKPTVEDVRPGREWLSVKEVVELAGGTESGLHGWMNNHMSAAWHETYTQARIGGMSGTTKLRWLHQDELDAYAEYVKTKSTPKPKRSNTTSDNVLKGHEGFARLYERKFAHNQERERRYKNSLVGKLKRMVVAIRKIWREKF